MLRASVAVAAALVVAACTPVPAPSPTPSPILSPSVLDRPGIPDVPVAEHPALDVGPSPNRQEVAGQRDLPAAPGDLQAYWDQELDWTPCEGAECATMLVPLDWDDPSRAALEVAVTRRNAPGLALGVLFVNPGGPGGPARPIVQGLSADAVPGYDVVGMDPRGVGDSTAIDCDADALTAVAVADPSPDDDAERRLLVEAWSALARSCRERSGDLLDHVSTIDGARDLDLLRHLLGLKRTSFLGVSYGSLLGATYAELFPGKVGRFVLDGAVDITGTKPLISLPALEAALDRFATWCVDSVCPLGASVDDVKARVGGLFDDLDKTPLPVGERWLTQGLAARGVAGNLRWGETQYPRLVSDLQAALAGDGIALLGEADLAMDFDGGWLQSAFALPAIACSDHGDHGVDQALASIATAEAPVMGAFGVQTLCEVWAARPKPFLDITAEGAASILVIGNTGDPVTPFVNAEAMVERLFSARLLTVEGAGHIAVTRGDGCVTDAIGRYLLLGVLPGEGSRCSG